jgi:hypothetical protein
MNSPLAAFGIFSVSRYSCLKNGEISQWDCVGKQQVQVALGNLYLSVISYSGTDRGMEYAQEIAKRIVEKHEAKPFALPAFFVNNEISFNLSSVKLILGQLAIQNAYPEMEDVFASLNNYELWVLPFEFEGVKHTLLAATFSQSSDLQNVKDKLRNKQADKAENWIALNEKWLMIVRSKDANVIKEVLSKLTKEVKPSSGSN